MIEFERRIASSLLMITLGVVLLVGASGCTGPAHELAGAPWRLEAIERDGTSLAPVASMERPSIEFTPEGSGRSAHVNGFGGVNRYFGTCTFDGREAIEFSALGATMMAGPPERMELEGAFLGALGQARTYRRYRESLWLYFDGGLIRLTRPE